MWITLANAGVIKNRSDKALQKHVKRMTGLDNLRFCSGRQVNNLVESLKAIAQREGVKLG